MDRFGIPGTVRASFALYNTKEEIDVLIEAVAKAKVCWNKCLHDE